MLAFWAAAFFAAIDGDRNRDAELRPERTVQALRAVAGGFAGDGGISVVDVSCGLASVLPELFAIWAWWSFLSLGRFAGLAEWVQFAFGVGRPTTFCWWVCIVVVQATGLFRRQAVKEQDS